MVAEGCRQFAVLHREIAVAELIADYFVQSLVFVGNRSIYIDFRSGDKNGDEKRKAHDMVPVSMGKKQICLERALRQVVFDYMLSELADTGAGIQDDEALLLSYSKLYTGSIPAKLNCFGARAGN